jgi:GGDEF domain-containing protein
MLKMKSAERLAVNKPQALNGLLFPSSDPKTMGSVQTLAIIRFLRPISLALWLIIFTIEAQTIISTGSGGNWLVPLLATVLFVAAHAQFWYEESEQGRRFHNTLDRMRGRIYEDEETGLPNSRHFVFELRRQMMRSVRSGRGFSLVLTDIASFDRAEGHRADIVPAMGKALRQAFSEGDFIARLQGPVFAAIVSDDRDDTAADKADKALVGLGGCIPLDVAGTVYPVISMTGYEGEIEVRDFLRRAQRDLLSTRSRDVTVGLRNKQQHHKVSAA